MVYFGFAAAFGVLAGAVMIGRTMTSSLWWVAPWALLGQFTYMATYLSAGQMV
jgi:cytochrome c biogenesis factor